MNWICFQIGSRENYNIPVALSDLNKLELLVTDIWINRSNPIHRVLILLFPSLSNRSNPNIPHDNIRSFNFIFIPITIIERLFQFFINKNFNINSDKTFQKKCARFLEEYVSRRNDKFLIFSYNYSAEKIFEVSKRYGMYNVLGQIDAGPEAGKINRNLYEKYFDHRIVPNDLYLKYGNNWMNECKMADKIILNSEWSRKLISKAGVPEDKIFIIPVIYSRPPESKLFARQYPDKFTNIRPLEVLFLGSLKIMKGTLLVLEAAKVLKDKPVRITLVGHLKMPGVLLKNIPQNAHIIQGVNKSRVHEYYKRADIFILPTYSDGFAVTQLEALAWKLPVIVSENCGKVINDGVDGWLLNELSVEEISDRICSVLENPKMLVEASGHINDLNDFSTANLKANLEILESEIEKD